MTALAKKVAFQTSRFHPSACLLQARSGHDSGHNTCVRFGATYGRLSKLFPRLTPLIYCSEANHGLNRVESSSIPVAEVAICYFFLEMTGGWTYLFQQCLSRNCSFQASSTLKPNTSPCLLLFVIVECIRHLNATRIVPATEELRFGFCNMQEQADRRGVDHFTSIHCMSVRWLAASHARSSCFLCHPSSDSGRFNIFYGMHYGEKFHINFSVLSVDLTYTSYYS